MQVSTPSTYEKVQRETTRAIEETHGRRFKPKPSAMSPPVEVPPIMSKSSCVGKPQRCSISCKSRAGIRPFTPPPSIDSTKMGREAAASSSESPPAAASAAAAARPSFARGTATLPSVPRSTLLPPLPPPTQSPPPSPSVSAPPMSSSGRGWRTGCESTIQCLICSALSAILAASIVSSRVLTQILRSPRVDAAKYTSTPPRPPSRSFFRDVVKTNA